MRLFVQLAQLFVRVLPAAVILTAVVMAILRRLRAAANRASMRVEAVSLMHEMHCGKGIQAQEGRQADERDEL